MTMGERIRAAREEKQLTQTDLANLLGYKSRSSINKIETGGRDIPRSVIVKLAKALDVSPSYLMGWTDDPTDYKSLIDEVPDYLVDHFGDAEKAAKVWRKMERENQEAAAMERKPANYTPNVFQNNGENYGVIGNTHASVEIVNGTEHSLTAQETELLRLFSELSVIEQAKVLTFVAELKEKMDKAL